MVIVKVHLKTSWLSLLKSAHDCWCLSLIVTWFVLAVSLSLSMCWRNSHVARARSWPQVVDNIRLLEYRTGTKKQKHIVKMDCIKVMQSTSGKCTVVFCADSQFWECICMWLTHPLYCYTRLYECVYVCVWMRSLCGEFRVTLFLCLSHFSHQYFTPSPPLSSIFASFLGIRMRFLSLLHHTLSKGWLAGWLATVPLG